MKKPKAKAAKRVRKPKDLKMGGLELVHGDGDRFLLSVKTNGTFHIVEMRPWHLVALAEAAVKFADWAESKAKARGKTK